MLDDVHVSCVDVLVLLHEVVGEYAAEQFGWVDRMLLGHDVCCLLHAVGGYDDAVVGLGVGCFDGAFEEDADGHFIDCLGFACFITDDFVEADVVFAIAGC